jgi:hypothetical protein
MTRNSIPAASMERVRCANCQSLQRRVHYRLTANGSAHIKQSDNG